MADETTFYKPGLLFLSRKASAYQLHCRDAQFHVLPDGSREQTRPSLVADFGSGFTGGLSRLTDDDGNPINDLGGVFGVEGVAQSALIADSRGGAFDLDGTAEALGWTEEERELVARKMLQACSNPRNGAYGDFYVYEPPVPTAPWPNYDELHWQRIVTIAEDTGLVVEALMYERYTKNRPGVIEGLEKLLETESLVENELTVA